MNKQELIEKIGNLDRVYGEKFYVALDDVLDLVKQLDEPKKSKFRSLWPVGLSIVNLLMLICNTL